MDALACPKSAMCGRLRVGKSFLHVRRLVGAAMRSTFRCGSLPMPAFSAITRRSRRFPVNSFPRNAVGPRLPLHVLCYPELR